MSPQWFVRGMYLEACNCESVCPCRAHAGRPGGDATYERCEFALSWMVEEGRSGSLDLSGRSVALTGWYADTEPGKPWRVRLFVDGEAAADQHAALAAIFLGRAGGHPEATYGGCIDTVLGIESAEIHLEHRPHRWRIAVDGRVEVRASVPTAVEGPVTCGISGEDNPGTEYTAEVLRVTDDPFTWEVNGKASFVAPFAYHA